MLDQRMRTAVHEAGHACISRLLGLPSGPATIKDGEARAYLADDNGIASLVTALGGAAAETELLGNASRDGLLLDQQKVNFLLGANGIADDRQLWHESRRLVRLNRGRI
jgi:hypothetical protein